MTNELVEALDAWDRAQQVWITKRTAKTKTNPKPLPAPIDVQKMVLTGDRGRALTADAFRRIMIDTLNAASDARKSTEVQNRS
jgi:hypothetical protein